MTGLPEMPGGAHRYRAPDFDTLVDSPILVGNPTVHEFAVDGKRHYLVNEGEDGVFDGARAARDLEAVVREHRRMWGSLPYDRYLFINVISEAAGGLEHKNSTVLMTSRWTTRTPRAYLAWLETASHEFFHTWNVKRLRPVELGPFEYEKESLTRSLWIAEGFTDYYGALALHRAGLSTRDEFLEGLSSEIESLQTTPGRLVQSAELSSLDAWIKFYRPDENTSNSSVNYYTKGALIAFLLDARIRKATNGARGLDDVMRTAYDKYSGEVGYTPDQFRAIAEQVAGVSLQAFWHQAVESTAELDYSDALETFGLRFRPAASGQGRAWLGLTTRNDGGRLVVTRVQRDTPAHAAGVNVDDEILAIDEFRVRADRFENRLEQYKPGNKVSMLVARRDELMRLDVTFGSEPPRAWRLEVQASPTSAQEMQLRAWLQPPGR
jgi:predicted metalloprotease with PDZ domain